MHHCWVGTTDCMFHVGMGKSHLLLIRKWINVNIRLAAFLLYYGEIHILLKFTVLIVLR